VSLLLDALKRAEQEKLTRQGDRPSAPEPERRPSAPPPSPASVPVLELHPLGSAPAASPAAPRTDAQAAQAVFDAKSPPRAAARNRGVLWAIVAAGGVVLLAASAYVWYAVSALAPRPPVARTRPAPIAPPAADLNAPRQDLAPPPASLAAAVAPSVDLAPAPAQPQPAAAPSAVDELLKQAAPVSQGPVKLARSAEPKPRVPPDVQAGYDALVAGDLADARKRYAAALAADATNVDALLGLATVEARSANPAAAAVGYRRALELDPGNATAQAGLAALADFSRPEALEYALRTQLARAPDSAALQLTLGDLYASQGRWSEAQAAYFEAHRLQPENADVAYNLAVSLDRLGQRRAAADFYRRALEARRGAAAQFDPAVAARRLAELER
jgi:tetratricopeptide (TPR) repeat protein